MIRTVCTSLIAIMLCFNSYAQTDSLPAQDSSFSQAGFNSYNSYEAKKERPEPVYRLKPKVDIPVTIAAVAWDIFAFGKIYSKESSDINQINNLRIEDINGFDRWAADVYHEKAATSSDYFFYGSMPLPLVLMLDKDIRKDAAKIGFLYLETMALTGVLYTGANFFNDRFRPYAYNPNAPLNDRLEGGAKNSFFAGHVALVGTASFFTAKVFADYNPDSKLRHLLYALATTATVGTGYLRHRGGKHFPSDIVIGTAVGTLSGILVPHWHKNKDPRKNAVSLLPYFGGGRPGVAMVYKF